MLLEKVNSFQKFIILDHHDTAEKDLKGLNHEKIEVHFDQARSGAGLSWDFFHPNKERPTIINCVEDRDLWRFKIPDTKAFMATVGDENITIEGFEKIYKLTSDEKSFKSFLEKGKTILASKEKMVKDTYEQMAYTLEFEGMKASVINFGPLLRSEMGNYCLEQNKEVDLAICWYQVKNGKFKYSLRTRKDGPEIHKIAERFNGGGHPHAASFYTDDFILK